MQDYGLVGFFASAVQFGLVEQRQFHASLELVGGVALAGLAACRAKYSLDLYNAASDADCAIQICLNNYQAPQSMINSVPYGTQPIRLPHPQYLQD